MAWFISPHGFGHAARSTALMNAVHRLAPDVEFEITTTIPAWFFEESLSARYRLYPEKTDVGLIQSSPLRIDLDKTVAALDEMLPYPPDRIRHLAETIRRTGVRAVVCDIAPLGIAVAREAGVPSVLVENFTWDWIYAAYTDRHPGLKPHIAHLDRLFRAADCLIQTEPCCLPRNPDLWVGPISRKARLSRARVRQKLGIGENTPAVLITMGGIPETHGDAARFQSYPGVHFIVPGANPGVPENGRRQGSLTLLPHHSQFYHPDLIRASDAVVGKVGYSTLAEVCDAGIPFGYITRPDFRESQVLAAYVKAHLHGLHIEEQRFRNQDWLYDLPSLLALPRIERQVPDAAEIAARRILAVAGLDPR